MTYSNVVCRTQPYLQPSGGGHVDDFHNITCPNELGATDLKSSRDLSESIRSIVGYSISLKDGSHSRVNKRAGSNPQVWEAVNDNEPENIRERESSQSVH